LDPELIVDARRSTIALRRRDEASDRSRHN
jgi:hypothetical protein